MTKRQYTNKQLAKHYISIATKNILATDRIDTYQHKADSIANCPEPITPFYRETGMFPQGLQGTYGILELILEYGSKHAKQMAKEIGEEVNPSCNKNHSLYLQEKDTAEEKLDPWKDYLQRAHEGDV